MAATNFLERFVGIMKNFIIDNFQFAEENCGKTNEYWQKLEISLHIPGNERWYENWLMK